MDVLDTIINVLTNNWTASNTDSITPTIGRVTDYKRIDVASTDWVLCYEIDEIWEPNAIGGKEWATINDVSIDIRTTYNSTMNVANLRSHVVKIADEVKRIIKANIANPDANFQLLFLTRKKDLSDRSVGLGRMTIDVRLRNYGVT